MRQVHKKICLTIDSVLRTAINEQMSHTNLSFESYTARVTEHYFGNVSEPLRSFPLANPSCGKYDAWECNRANARKLGRLLNVQHNLHMPAVLIPSLIAALDEPFKGNTATAICELISPERRTTKAKDGHPLEVLELLMKEQAEALQAFLSVGRNGLSDDSTQDLMNARIQLIQAREATDLALSLLNDELLKRNIVRAV